MAVELDSMKVDSCRLENLPPRPPTPPRLRDDTPSAALLSSWRPRSPDEIRPNLQTPPNCSSSDPTAGAVAVRNSGASIGSRSKKVTISDAPEYRDHPNDSQTWGPTPPSTRSSGPLKGILKQARVVGPDVNKLDPHGPRSLGSPPINMSAMLASLEVALAQGDRDDRVDAYSQLRQYISKSNSVADRAALKDKMVFILSRIRQDIIDSLPRSSETLSVTYQAIELLITFMTYQGVANLIPAEFRCAMMDHCIKSLDDPNTGKEMARRLMQLIAAQGFSSKIMTETRLSKLLASLNDIDLRLPGKSIVGARLKMYSLLIKECRQQMVNSPDWIRALLRDLLSESEEIRLKAVELGEQAAFSVGKEKNIVRQTLDVYNGNFETDSDETSSYAATFVARLNSMVHSAKDREAVLVPRIWAVVAILLGVSRLRALLASSSSFFTPIETCFNCSNIGLNHEAARAWNRLIAAAAVEDFCSQQPESFMLGPILGLLDRRASSKRRGDWRRLRLGTVCNFLYYALRPGNVPQLDDVWSIGPMPLLKKLVAGIRGGDVREAQLDAAEILASLFAPSPPSRAWNVDRIKEHYLAEPADLVPLDRMWIRRRAPELFSLVGPILQSHWIELHRKDSVIHRLWANFVGAVAFAASKDVMVARESATFVAEALGLLALVWSQGPNSVNRAEVIQENREQSQEQAQEQGQEQEQPNPEQQNPEKQPPLFLLSAQEFVRVMVESLGTLPFTNNKAFLVRGAGHTFQVSKKQGRSPLHHLVSILTSVPQGIDDDEALASVFRTVLAPFLGEKADDLLKLLPEDEVCPYGLWAAIWDTTSSLIGSRSYSSSLGSGQPVGHDRRNAVKLLEQGLLSTPNLALNEWNAHLQTFSSAVVEELGSAGQAIILIEPLSKRILDHSSKTEDGKLSPRLQHGSACLLHLASYPRDSNAIESARSRLWGTSIAGPRRPPTTDPFEHLYDVVNAAMAAAYNTFRDLANNELAATLLSEVAGFLVRCPERQASQSLGHLQDGISSWIQDEKEQVGSQQTAQVAAQVSAAGMVSSQVVVSNSSQLKRLSETVTSIMFASPAPSSELLVSFEKLLCASFDSKQRFVVNIAVGAWNRWFDGASQDQISYPEQLKSVLLSIQNLVMIALPGLDDKLVTSGAQRHSFVDSQEDLNRLDGPSTYPATPRRVGRSRGLVTTTPTGHPVQYNVGPANARDLRSLASAPGELVRTPRQPAETTPQLRSSARQPTSQRRQLRHDDSQVYFVPIDTAGTQDDLLQSQLLTERQREVRERQRETAALFSDIPSSPSMAEVAAVCHEKELAAEGPSAPSGGEPAATPAAADYEEFMCSTPTPRRGQVAMPIADHDADTDPDMSEITSSPPEPRRYPLLDNTTARTAASNRLEGWPLTSSPVSGSPIPSHQRAEDAPGSVSGAIGESCETTSREAHGSDTGPSDVVMVDDAPGVELAHTTSSVLTTDNDVAAAPAPTTGGGRPRRQWKVRLGYLDPLRRRTADIASPAIDSLARSIGRRESDVLGHPRTSSDQSARRRSLVDSELGDASMLHAANEVERMQEQAAEAQTLGSGLKGSTQRPKTPIGASTTADAAPQTDRVASAQNLAAARDSDRESGDSSAPDAESVAGSASEAGSANESLGRASVRTSQRTNKGKRARGTEDAVDLPGAKKQRSNGRVSVAAPAGSSAVVPAVVPATEPVVDSTVEHREESASELVGMAGLRTGPMLQRKRLRSLYRLVERRLTRHNCTAGSCEPNRIPDARGSPSFNMSRNAGEVWDEELEYGSVGTPELGHGVSVARASAPVNPQPAGGEPPSLAPQIPLEPRDGEDVATKRVPFAPETRMEDSSSPSGPASEARKVAETPMDRIRGFLIGLTNELKTASLSREEVMEMEDLYLNMKRAMLEAEERGRAQRSL